MTDLTAVEHFIAWQEDRTLDGKTATLEEYREHLEQDQLRTKLFVVHNVAMNTLNLVGAQSDDMRDALRNIAQLTEPTKEIDL